MPPDPNVLLGVAAWVTNDRGHLLIIQRVAKEGRFAKEGQGRWSVPGGWPEFGETLEQTAEREAMEETGVTAKAVRVLGQVCNETEDGSAFIHTVFIHCEYVSGQPRITEPDKCQGVAFAQWSHVQSLWLFRPTELFINKYRGEFPIGLLV